MRVLVLGATGFIGGQIARAAHRAGLEVHGLRRRPDAVGAIGDVPLTWHTGDLGDRASLAAALRGCEVLFHAAGYVPLPGEYNTARAVRQGVEEMRRVLGAAAEAGLRRVVYTSSLSTIGAAPAGSGRLADERDGYLPGSTRNPYYEAKWAMEHEALRATQAGLPVVILCPTAVFGPGDVKPSTSQVLLEVAKGRLPAAVDVMINIVDGRDVAQAHLNAINRAAPGERIIIGGHNLNVGEAFRQAAQLVGARPPRWTLSRAAVQRLLRIAEGLRLPIHSTMRAIPTWQALNVSRGWDVLEFTPRPFEDTVLDTVGWFREHGYL